MAEKVLMIALSPTMEQGTIVSWQKKEGDAVSTGDLLCQVETDKATMDYESSMDGTLLKILVPEGSQASVGDAIAVIGNKGEDIASLISGSGKKAEAPEKGTRPPEQQGKAAPEETSDRTVKAEAESETNVGRPDSERQPVAAPVKDDTEREEAQAAADTVRRGTAAESGLERYHTPGRIKASPLARKIARIKGIDLSLVRGTGTGGRITREDVRNWNPESATPEKAPAKPGGGVPSVQPGIMQSEKRIPVGGKRAVIARRLSESKFSAPHFYLRKAVFVEEMFRARESLNSKRKDKIGLNAFIIKLCAEAIKRHPVVNTGWAGDTMIQYGSIDIGTAVAVSDGLVVPVVRNCGQKGIIEIDGELRELIEKARANRLMPEDYAGATFTISNLGAYGTDEFTAIINPPGSAILAIGSAKKEPVVNDQDLIIVRQVMRLTLSCDHRVIDGAAGAEFLRDLAEIIENPMSALF